MLHIISLATSVLQAALVVEGSTTYMDKTAVS